jgi:hypothetical protein
MTLNHTVGLIAAFTCMSLQAAAAAAPGDLRVGVAKVEITPADLTNMIPVGGIGSFESVHDSIFARALVLDSGAGAVAIVALDLIEVGDTIPLRQRIQNELGIAADHIMITASHDHSAPKLLGGNPQWDAFLKATNEKIFDALKRAKASMQVARMGLGTGSADVSVNRDLYRPPGGWGLGFNPAGVSDKTVWVVKFESLAGEPIAVLFNYAVHSTVTFNSWVVTGDLAGAAERVVEQRYGDKVVALFTIGAAGDQAPKFSGGTQSVAVAPSGTARGAAQSEAAAAAAARAAPAGPRDRTELRRTAFPAMEAQGFMLGSEVLRVANQIQAHSTAPRIMAAESMLTCPAKQEKQWEQFKDGVPIRLGVILIDQVAFASVSGEVVTNIYWRLKKASPLANTIMVSLTNGRMGYLADDATYDNTGTFEVGASPVARGCAESGIVDGLVKLIRQIL